MRGERLGSAPFVRLQQAQSRSCFICRAHARRLRPLFLRSEKILEGAPMLQSLVLALALQASGAAAASAPPSPPSQWQTSEADFVARSVRFAAGDTLAEVRIH